ncbi:MAG: hypothetical protein ACI94Y_002427 [Maribacter sp.]|jgi:hypothetical protein
MRNNVTSSATLFWKIFFPTFWIVFFFTLAMGLAFSEIKPTSIPKEAFTILMFVTLILGIILLYLTVIRLKKVEMDEDFIYVTNYFKWYKYPYHNVDRIIEKDLVLAKIITLKFKEPGKFGKKIFFLANHRKLNEFLEEYPQVTEKLFQIDV